MIVAELTGQVEEEQQTKLSGASTNPSLNKRKQTGKY